MKVELIAGGNTLVPTSTLVVRVKSGIAANVSAFRLYADGKTRADDDFVFYGQKQSHDRSLLMLTEGDNTAFAVSLNQLHNDVQKIAFTITLDGGQVIQAVRSLQILVEDAGQTLLSGLVDLDGRQEAALILGELYRRNNEWKFRFVAQGFNGGLQPLAEYFGVEIAQPAADRPVLTTSPVKPAAVNLHKVTLTKEKPSINLSKSVNLAKEQGFGKIRVNLNWNKGTNGGFFAKSTAIDLDLGAYVKFKNGRKDLIQALGNNFGAFNHSPYIELEDDDRSGSCTEGEWLNINGAKWDEISEIVIFTFIYRGVPNWAKTDGVVTLNLPHQPPVEAHLIEDGNQKMMCAVARLENDNGSLQVHRLIDYFSGHKAMDDAYGWGFNWRAGSK